MYTVDHCPLINRINGTVPYKANTVEDIGHKFYYIISSLLLILYFIIFKPTKVKLQAKTNSSQVSL